MTVNDWIGSLGVFLILLAYFCNVFKLINNTSALFFLLNIVGATLACIASYLIQYWPFVILEGTWAVVSLLGWLQFKRQ